MFEMLGLYSYYLFSYAAYLRNVGIVNLVVIILTGNEKLKFKYRSSV